ncbi:precorrin-6A reductase [Halanaerobacter jeridensis]|uniref:Precorrin-6A/cobalt-precorrin-6A reductase n=1 Tax=Halanaerobacter jeridensis TaxID=706427 RepID=A0A938XUH2_9FIRM|nr:precorrin-6A reductase [Halanaerobacter jeridensis]MBM7557119.1 precorrin-6A/cobalt-precorrin-6A reductase [Halanaerobacter jeridensis]
MILVLAGTKDSREVIAKLKQNGSSIIASVTTEYGANLLSDLDIIVKQEKLDDAKMKQLLRDYEVDTIIDVTHPFAVTISKTALEVSAKSNIKYIRFERGSIESREHELLIKVNSYQEAARKAKEFEKILLTIGSKNLDYFTAEIEDWQQRLLARVLPNWKFIKRVQELGFSPQNLIAMQGPFSKQLNQVLLEDYEIDLLVTKASGKTGGVDTKLEAALELDIPVLLITRPELDYNNLVKNYQELLQEVKRGEH